MNKDIKKAIAEGIALRPVVETEERSAKKREQEKEKAILKNKEDKDQEWADKILARLPEYIKSAVAHKQTRVEVCGTSDSYPPYDIKAGYYAKVADGLTKMGLTPQYGHEAWEDWNSYDTGYAKHCSRDYIYIELPILDK